MVSQFVSVTYKKSNNAHLTATESSKKDGSNRALDTLEVKNQTPRSTGFIKRTMISDQTGKEVPAENRPKILKRMISKEKMNNYEEFSKAVVPSPPELEK